MKFQLEEYATNEERIQACKDLLAAGKRLDSSEYKDGNKETRNEIRTQAMKAALPVVESDCFQNWISRWFNLRKDIKASNEVITGVKKVLDFFIRNADTLDKFEYRKMKKALETALKEGNYRPMVIEALEKVVENSYSYKYLMPPVEAFIDKVKKHPKFKLAIERGDLENDMSDLEMAKGGDNLIKHARKKAEFNKRLQTLAKNTSYVQSPLTERIKAIREKFKNNDGLSTEEVYAVGEIVFDEFNKLDLGDDIHLEEEKKKAHEEYVAQRRAGNKEKEEEAYSRYRGLEDRLSETKQENSRKSLKYLAGIRPLWNGDPEKLKALCSGRSMAGKTIHEAIKMLPAEIAEIHLAKGKLEVKSAQGRGSYKGARDTIRTDDTSTSVHELGHRLEHTIPKVLELEREFYERRTKGQPLESLKWLTGCSYRAGEKAIKDHFLDPYMGKTYEGRAYELVSMGFEYFYFEPNKLRQDPDYSKFILGILATL